MLIEERNSFCQHCNRKFQTLQSRSELTLEGSVVITYKEFRYKMFYLVFIVQVNTLREDVVVKT